MTRKATQPETRVAFDAREALRALVEWLDAGDPVPGEPRFLGVDSLQRRSAALTRWTPLAQIENNGHRYVIARVNGSFESLSPRERQTLDAASRGHSNKVIAYELGLSASTVRVLLLRARIKLGVSNRAEAIRLCASTSARNGTLARGDDSKAIGQ